MSVKSESPHAGIMSLEAMTSDAESTHEALWRGAEIAVHEGNVVITFDEQGIGALKQRFEHVQLSLDLPDERGRKVMAQNHGFSFLIPNALYCQNQGKFYEAYVPIMRNDMPYGRVPFVRNPEGAEKTLAARLCQTPDIKMFSQMAASASWRPSAPKDPDADSYAGMQKMGLPEWTEKMLKNPFVEQYFSAEEKDALKHCVDGAGAARVVNAFIARMQLSKAPLKDLEHFILSQKGTIQLSEPVNNPHFSFATLSPAYIESMKQRWGDFTVRFYLTDAHANRLSENLPMDGETIYLPKKVLCAHDKVHLCLDMDIHLPSSGLIHLAQLDASLITFDMTQESAKKVCPSR